MLSNHSTRACGAFLLLWASWPLGRLRYRYKAPRDRKGQGHQLPHGLDHRLRHVLRQRTTSPAARYRSERQLRHERCPLGEVMITVSVPKPPPGGWQ